MQMREQSYHDASQWRPQEPCRHRLMTVEQLLDPPQSAWLQHLRDGQSLPHVLNDPKAMLQTFYLTRDDFESPHQKYYRVAYYQRQYPEKQDLYVAEAHDRF